MPYKPKRKTKATIARDKGLQPLADEIFAQGTLDIFNRAKFFINKDVLSVDEALQGARDIIAERVSEDKNIRELVRATYEKHGVIKSKVKIR